MKDEYELTKSWTIYKIIFATEPKTFKWLKKLLSFWQQIDNINNGVLMTKRHKYVTPRIRIDHNPQLSVNKCHLFMNPVLHCSI